MEQRNSTSGPGLMDCVKERAATQIGARRIARPTVADWPGPSPAATAGRL